MRVLPQNRTSPHSIVKVGLFLRSTSCLDAFSSYPTQRSYPAMQTQPVHQRLREHVPFVLVLSSSQTNNTFNRERPNCLTTFWTQLTSPFNQWTPAPLVATAQPGGGEPTAEKQCASSMWTLGGHDSIIPEVAFLIPPDPIKRYTMYR